jgi:hypothetical protein
MAIILSLQTVALVDTWSPDAQIYLKHDDVSVPEPIEGEVLIKLECTGGTYSFS